MTRPPVPRCSRRLCRAVLALGLLAVVLPGTVTASTPTPTPRPPSAFGNYAVFSIAVSPLYRQTGLVVAMSSSGTGCTGYCLWVSHDGGATWSRSPATGWQSGTPSIAVDGAGHEVLYAHPQSLQDHTAPLQQSVDGGATWHTIGLSGGMPWFAPSYPRDGMVAVAAGDQ